MTSTALLTARYSDPGLRQGIDQQMCRSALGESGVLAPSLVTGVMLDKEGGEGRLSPNQHMVEHLAHFLMTQRVATISTALNTVR